MPNLLVLVGILALGWPAYPVIALYWFDATVVLALAMPQLRAIRAAEGCPGLLDSDRDQLVGSWAALAIFAVLIFGGPDRPSGQDRERPRHGARLRR